MRHALNPITLGDDVVEHDVEVGKAEWKRRNDVASSPTPAVAEAAPTVPGCTTDAPPRMHHHVGTDELTQEVNTISVDGLVDEPPHDLCVLRRSEWDFLDT